jgi:hypothetical protein
MKCLDWFERWDLGFESHSRNEYMCVCILCLCCPVRSYRPCDGLITPRKCSVICVTEEEARVQQRAVESLIIWMNEWTNKFYAITFSLLPIFILNLILLFHVYQLLHFIFSKFSLPDGDNSLNTGLARTLWCNSCSLSHSWSWTFLEKPPIVHLLKNFPAVFGTRNFIAVFTGAFNWSLFWARPTRFIPYHPILSI